MEPKAKHEIYLSHIYLKQILRRQFYTIVLLCLHFDPDLSDEVKYRILHLRYRVGAHKALDFGAFEVIFLASTIFSFLFIYIPHISYSSLACPLD